MAYNYDALYRDTADALGAPTKAFVAFFEMYSKPGARVLDIGCGQGRDALFIARLGHEVTGVDLSPAGINCLDHAARAEGLNITGIVADIVTFHPKGLFEVIVIDRTLHMLAEADRVPVLGRFLGHVAPGGFVLIADEPANLPGFRKAFLDDPSVWDKSKYDRGFLFAQRSGRAA